MKWCQVIKHDIFPVDRIFVISCCSLLHYIFNLFVIFEPVVICINVFRTVDHQKRFRWEWKLNYFRKNGASLLTINHVCSWDTLYLSSFSSSSWVLELYFPSCFSHGVNQVDVGNTWILCSPSSIYTLLNLHRAARTTTRKQTISSLFTDIMMFFTT